MKNKILDNVTHVIDDVLSYCRQNKYKFLLLVAIVFVGAFLRLYRIDEYMTFLGDEGRDVIVVRRLLVDLDPILVGPGTSIGNMYLGPLYYYMMAPALLLANFSPVGPAVMIALLGVLTILFVWYIAREWFGEIAAFAAVSMYAVSTVVIRYSQSSWNPNIMPFFALLTIYSIWRVWQYFEWKWLVVTGISMAFVLQSHYLGLLLIPVVGIFWLMSVFIKKDERLELRKLFRYTLLGTAVFVLLMSPLVIFDARHGWRNFEAMKIFFTHRQTTVSARPWTAVPDLFDHFHQIITTVITAGNETIGAYVSYFMVLVLIVFVVNLFRKEPVVNKVEKSFWLRLFHRINVRKNAPYTLLFVWLITALFGFGVYKQHIYSHYFGFLFPVPMLLIGGVAETIWDRFGKFGQSIVTIIIIFLVFINFQKTPIKYPPNRQMQRTEAVADKIIEESGGERFNLAVIAERNYEGAYQYFLERDNAPIVMIDPQRAEETITDQLFVVCELPKDECDPVNNEKAGIANFGWSKVKRRWSVAGTTLFKLAPFDK